MYLSRLTLNPHSRRVQREVADPYEMHRSLLRSFPDGIDRRGDRVLFRVDVDPRTGVPTVLVQSTLEPNWDWLKGNGCKGYVLRPPESKPFGLRLSGEQLLVFRLRANPTVKRRRSRNDGEARPVRDPLYREPEQRAWLDRKGEQGGFRVTRVSVAPEGNVVAWRRENNHRHRLTLFSVRFDGLLRVTDPDGLAETVRQGIGTAKGLGFGLLSLAPAPLRVQEDQ